MYLKELELFGFKSFPQKTSLKFEAGITVVVGPNGCGKSNILDAIRWALGEQSPKSLRGSKMEDVIFNGTENHPPLNYTEVILNFSNEDKYLPIDYKEVSAARRLYRSGESQYFINKNLVRLKDIQNLFIGTGIGESTYSFIEQGRIEIFLGYKPEEKRVIFDEASGIINYKERKRETLRRLEETEENILRLEDILSEVKRQIRYLERQVEKARKYKKVEEQLIEVEKKIATLQFSDLEKKTNRLLEELNSLKQEEEKKDSQLQEAKDKWEDCDLQLRELRKNLEAANTEIISLRAQIENSITHISVLEQRGRELKARNKNIENTKNSLKKRSDLQEKRIQGERKDLESFKAREKEVSDKLKSLREKEDNLKKEIEEAKKKIANQKVKIFESESERINTQNSLIEIQTNLSTLLKRKQRLSLDKGRLEGFLEESSKKSQTAKEALDELKENLDELKETKNRLSSQEEELNLQREDLKNRLIEKEKELIELKSYFEFLKDLHIKYEIISQKKKVTVIFDEEPGDINKLIASLNDVEFIKEGDSYKATISAKVISLQEDQLEKKISTYQEEIKKTKSAIDNLERKKEEFAEKINLEIKQITEKERRYQERLQEKEGLSKEERRLNEESELLAKETDSTLREASELEAKEKDAENKLTFYEESLNKIQEDLKNNQELVSMNLETIKDIDIEMAKREEQKTSLDKEKDSLISKINLLEEEKVNLSRNLEEIDKEKEENEARLVSLGEEVERLKLKIEEGKRGIAEHNKKKINYEKEEISQGKELEKKREAIKGLDEETEKLKTSLYNKKLEIQSVEYEKEKIKDYMRQVYHIEFAPQSADELSMSLEQFCEEREKLRKKKESLGEVNLAATEEFEELKKRNDFLGKQKGDLITSKENLKKAIQKINRISKELFLETFAKIEEEFKKNFRFLFGGGRAQVFLLDQEDVLESGVEIEVQPPGKKLQNVSLLSGGEKALTAIALIFAIFRVKPSPLCVLDEIDAPLDEANVDRFNHLLKGFAASSQYFLITHNKKTMSNADVLYGVTMQEKGVSKLVSVKFASQGVPSSP